MKLYDVSETVAKAQRELGRRGETDRLFYCYRCYDCHRLITKLEVLEGRAQGRPNLCPCGSRKVNPTNAKWYEELFLPRCWKLIFAIRRKRIAPMPPPPTPEEQAEADRMAREAMRAFEAQMREQARGR